jgi:hypothetical protein
LGSAPAARPRSNAQRQMSVGMSYLAKQRQ